MRILTLNRIIFFILFLIFLSIKSCVSSDESNEEPIIIKNEVQKSLLPDNDEVTINTLDKYISLKFSEDNKNNYIASFNILPNNILKIEIHKFLFNDNLKQHIASDYIIENNNNYKYELNYNQEEINFSVKDFYLKEEYNSMIKSKHYNNNQHQISFIDLTNKEFCSKNNSFVFLTEENNHEWILSLRNNHLNNLLCEKNQIIPLLNTYTFKDERDFSLLPQKILIKNIKDNISNAISTYDYIDFYFDDDYFYFSLNQDIKTKKSIKIIKENRTLNLQISELDLHNSIPISFIKVSKKDMINHPSFYVSLENYNQSHYYTEVEQKDINNLFNISFYKENFSVIKNLDCQNYSYSNLTQVVEENNSYIYFNKNKYNNSYECEVKPLVSQISFQDELKFNNGLIFTNLFLKNNFDIEYDDDSFVFKSNSDYDIYDYSIENDQLFVYVDKESKSHILINDKIEKVKAPYFSNINVVNVESNNYINQSMLNVFKSYRQINEDLNINIFKFNHQKNVEYYLLRSNTIQFNKDFNKCNFNFNIKQIADSKYDLYIQDEINPNCEKYGTSVIILKKIGYNTELNFKENRSDLLLNHLKDKHDLFYKSINNINSEKFKLSSSLLLINKEELKYSIDIEYLNNNFEVELNSEIINGATYLFLREKNNIKTKNNESILIPFNNKLNIIYEDLDGNQEKFNLNY